jgi:NADH:ubiquinone oxidoreductase subunit D
MDLALAPKLGGHMTLWMEWSWSDRTGVFAIREQAAGLVLVACFTGPGGVSEVNVRALLQSAMRSLTAWRISCFVPR